MAVSGVIELEVFMYWQGYRGAITRWISNLFNTSPCRTDDPNVTSSVGRLRLKVPLD